MVVTRNTRSAPSNPINPRSASGQGMAAAQTRRLPSQSVATRTRASVVRTPTQPLSPERPEALPQQQRGYDLKGAGNPVYTTEQQLTDAFRSQDARKTELDEQLRLGKITADDYKRETSQMFTQPQYEQAVENLKKYGTGVDPLGFGTPTIAGTEGFNSVEDAQKANEEYYRQHGTTDPRIDSAIHAFQNPQQYQGARFSGTAEMRRAADQARKVASAPQSSYEGLTGEQRSYAAANDAASRASAQTELTQMQEQAYKRQEFRQSQAPITTTQGGTQEKKPTSTAIPELDETINLIKGFANNSMGVSQQVFSAILPSLTNILTRIQSSRTRADEIDTAEERAALAERMIEPEKALALRRENDYIRRKEKDDALLKENRDILVEANRITTEALDLDKKMFEEQRRIGEIKQMALNVEGEKKLRRSLNDLGIENSPNATSYLQGKIQEAADTLQSMITTNNLTALKFTKAREGLNNDLRGILNEFDAKKAALNASFDDNIFNLDQFVSGARKGAVSELKDEWKKLLESEDTLMKEYGNKIENATLKAIELQQKEYENSKKGAMSTKDKLGFVSSIRSGINQNKVITQAKDVDGFYGALNAGYNEYLSLIATNGGMQKEGLSLNPSQSAVIGSLARMLDPGSVVRNEEYERQVLGQSAPNIIRGWLEKLGKGGTGLTKDDVVAMKKLADGLHDSWEEKLSQEMQPFIIDIQDWNANYPDAQIKYEQVIPVDRVHLPSQQMQTWGDAAGWSGSTSASGGGTGATRSNLNAQSTLHDFFSVYAPSADNNNPLAYAEFVAKKLGVTKDTKIGELRDRVSEFAQAISEHEGFGSPNAPTITKQNNPGALKYVGQHGAVRGEKGFARFATLEDGWNALENDIRSKIGESSIAGIQGNTASAYDGIEFLPSEDDDFETKKNNLDKYVSVIMEPENSGRKLLFNRAGTQYGEYFNELGRTTGDLIKFSKYLAEKARDRVSTGIESTITPFAQGFSESMQ